MEVVKAHGIPDENVIVMMADDIAFNPRNRDQGIIINRPNGPNVRAIVWGTVMYIKYLFFHLQVDNYYLITTLQNPGQQCVAGSPVPQSY